MSAKMCLPRKPLAPVRKQTISQFCIQSRFRDLQTGVYASVLEFEKREGSSSVSALKSTGMERSFDSFIDSTMQCLLGHC